MNYMVNINDISDINFAPSNTVEEILQNVKIIVTTLKGTVPLDRTLGIDPKIIDSPIDIIKIKLGSSVIEAINKYEPRAKVKNIFFNSNGLDGLVIAKIEVSI